MNKNRQVYGKRKKKEIEIESNKKTEKMGVGKQ